MSLESIYKSTINEAFKKEVKTNLSLTEYLNKNTITIKEGVKLIVMVESESEGFIKKMVSKLEAKLQDLYSKRSTMSPDQFNAQSKSIHATIAKWMALLDNARHHYKKQIRTAALAGAAAGGVLYGVSKYRKHQLAKKAAEKEKMKEAKEFKFDPFLSEDFTGTVGTVAGLASQKAKAGFNKVASGVQQASKIPFEKRRAAIKAAVKAGKADPTDHFKKNINAWRGKLARAGDKHKNKVAAGVIAAGALYGAHKIRQHLLKKKAAEKVLTSKNEAKLMFYTELRNFIFENFKAIDKNPKLLKEGINIAGQKVYEFIHSK